MPTLSEFILTIGLRRHEMDGTQETFFRFQTVREFQVFRYEVEVSNMIDTVTGSIFFTIKGVRAPVGLMSDTGAAINEIVYPALSGEYTVTVTGAKQTGSFRLRVASDRLDLVEADTGDMVQLRLLDQVEVIRS